MTAKTTASGRFLKLAGLTARIAGQSLGNKLRSITADEEQKQQQHQQLLTSIGVQIAQTLGEMKGAAMKVGQIASQYKDLFPPEIATELAKLQRQAPPVAFDVIQQQIERALKQPWQQVFQSVEQQPFAAASIGQVHRAILHDGRKVVIKVQYPHVEDVCRSDLKSVRLALRLMGVLKIDAALQDCLFAEIEDSLLNELNYELEAHHLRLFAQFHANRDEKIIIPQVIDEYSSRYMLVLSEEQGHRMQIASTWQPSLRNALGRRLFKAICDQIFILQRFHCDPHPGNFAFREDGSVIMYDFGAVKGLSDTTVDQFKQLIAAAKQGSVTAVEQQLMALQMLTQAGQFPAELYQQWFEVLLRPLTQPYDFAQNSAHHDARALIKPSLQYWQLFRPSPYTLLMNRTISGHYWNLIHLKVHDDLSDLLRHYDGTLDA
ncbi:MAG: AarF/ABC1/UbiB kinase family protein [Acinetobacter sp.]|nr:AarF/ABC1/UbiB kinase family protein [Acinetobacter sp.]